MHSQSAGGNHRSMIFRCDNLPTITVQLSSGATTQPATTSMIAFPLSGVTTQPVNHAASSTRASIKFSLNISCRTQLQQPAQSAALLDLQEFNRRYLRPNFESSKEQKNHWTTIVKMLEPATPSCSLNSSIQVSKLVSIESPKEDELSATNLAPNDGENQQQSQ
ncbi:poly(A)-specific ribonuclease PARN [Dorcoceras hygrometricum]|uniref:Poly(A)-specific ribonuclease PARN n=1 Tax=Dorcoceras hygrometricum TaxID=472368 RepID=A0A2Z7CUD2_9LAMI|nr:poly(A)-specific ribonuclease PARN [Dorcoceras hygrometricum]